MRSPVVYILKCRNGRFYVGVTSNIERRLSEHGAGEVEGYTKTFGPCELVWLTQCPSMIAAIQLEKQIKGWRRHKKIALIEGRYEDLPDLATPYWKRLPNPPLFDGSE